MDALWRQERLVVELDGIGNHGTPGADDPGPSEGPGAAGFVVLRYSSPQVFEEPALVVADLSARLRERQIATH